MMGNLGIAQKLALTFALGPLALIAVGFVSFSEVKQLLAVRNILLHTLEVRATITRMQASVAEALAGTHGYLLTGRDTDISLYNDAVVRANQELTHFTSLTPDNPHQVERAQTLRALFAQEQTLLGGEIRAQQQHQVKTVQDDLRSGTSNKLRAQIVSALNDADTEEAQLQQTRDSAAELAATSVLNSIFYGTAGTIVVLGILAFFLIRSISKPVQDAINALSSATAEILAGTTQQASGIQEQAAAVAQTVTTVEEITQTADQANERAKTVAESSRRAADNGATGRKSVEDTISAMGDVKTRTQSIAESILALAEQAQAIGEIIAVVNDLAEQTNILALNASIEATRAGEQGKGFSVVASEIKALAEQSKKSTVQVRQILTEIQRSTNTAVMATEHGTKSVDEAVRTVNEADDAIRLLVETIVEAAQASIQISTSVGQQAIGMSQIQQAMRNISQATSQNLASTQQAEQAARHLDTIGTRLQLLLRGAAA
ncbi:MAG: methyl-accepting chemotaxis protein [Vulcanimicrobiaceae bacterium]